MYSKDQQALERQACLCTRKDQQALERQACLCTPANAGFFVFGMREIRLNKTGMFSSLKMT